MAYSPEGVAGGQQADGFQIGSASDRPEPAQLFTTYQTVLMKISVAIALIRRKPAHKTARQHAEEVAHEYREQETNWKQKVTRLQNEVLRLRQHQLLSTLPNTPIPTVSPTGPTVPESSNGSSALQVRNGVQVPVDNGQRSGEGAAVCQNGTAQAGRAARDGGVAAAVREHCYFLHKLSECLKAPQVLETLASCPEDATVAFQGTFTTVVRELCRGMDNCSSSSSLPQSLFKTAINSLIACFDLPIAAEFQESIAQELWNLLDLTVKRILHNTCPCSVRMEQQCELAWCVSQLATRLPPLTLDACVLLVDRICQVAKSLTNDTAGLLAVNYSELDNVFYCFKALEDILITTAPLLPLNATTAMWQRLDDATQHTADLYPYFTHYVWKLEVTLTQSVFQT